MHQQLLLLLPLLLSLLLLFPQLLPPLPQLPVHINAQSSLSSFPPCGHPCYCHWLWLPSLQLLQLLAQLLL